MSAEVRVKVLSHMAAQLERAGSARDHELLLHWIIEHLDELEPEGVDCE